MAGVRQPGNSAFSSTPSPEALLRGNLVLPLHARPEPVTAGTPQSSQRPCLRLDPQPLQP